MSFFKTETVFTGLSDFHKLVLPVFKLHFLKAKTMEMSYRNLRDFKKDNFNWDLQNRLSAESVEECTPFVFLDFFNKQTHLKKNVVRANHAPYITLRKAIMKLPHLEKIYFKNKTPDGKKHFESLNPRRISDNKSF